MKSITLFILLTTAFLTACSNTSPDSTVVIPTIIELPTSTTAATASPIIPLLSCRLFNWWSENYAIVTEYLDAFAVAYANPEQRVAITLQLNDARYYPDQNYSESCSEEAAQYWAVGSELLKIALRVQIEQGIDPRIALDGAAQYLYVLYRLDTNYAPRQLVDLPLLWGGQTLDDAAVSIFFATATADMAALRVEWTATVNGELAASQSAAEQTGTRSAAEIREMQQTNTAVVATYQATYQATSSR